ncbi:MAG: hypothetical protein KGL46_04890 [Hyphomicrobiales bacterium]|nr:hypothetical protein [Hyphomicrobiales bacterium]
METTDKTMQMRQDNDNRDLSQCCGVALGLVERADGFSFRVSLVFAESSLDILTTDCEGEARALWSDAARRAALPKFVERADGLMQEVEGVCGGVIARARAPRRRGSPLRMRRSRRALSRLTPRLAQAVRAQM